VRRLWRSLLMRRIERRLAGPKLLRAFAREYPEAFFVEIGSNDGDRHDHLRPLILAHAWRGVMVEPVPYVFERLRRNYAAVADRVELENAAVGERDGPAPFFHMAQAPEAERAGLPDWYDGIGSFSRETVLSHARKIPGMEARLVATEVPVLTFDSLLTKHGGREPDLVVIDAEGHDHEILRTIDLEAHRPRLVVYEHFHLSDADRAAARARLEAAGWDTMEEGFDTWCLDPRPADHLTALWHGLAPGVSGVSVHDEAA
jgi:FkbM family methyltransferase